MIPKQAFIHTLYWTGTYILLSVGYCFIGVLDQGLTYAAFSLPLILGATYFFIYWAVPSLLFNDRYMLFALVSTILLLVVLNIQIVIVALERLVYSPPAIDYLHGDTIYLMTCTVVFALPAITYESLRRLNRLQYKYNQQVQNSTSPITVKSEGKTYRLLGSDIYYIESYGDYAHIHLEDETVISRITLKSLEAKLTSFLRVHRSYLVNSDYCRAFNGKSVLIDDHEIPIGRTYKNEIQDTLENS